MYISNILVRLDPYVFHNILHMPLQNMPLPYY